MTTKPLFWEMDGSPTTTVPNKTMTTTIAEPQTIKGTIQKVIHYSEDSGYTVAQLKLENLQNLKIVGVMPRLSSNESVEVTGIMEQTEKWGSQFKVTQCAINIPTDIEGFERYLASGVIRGVRHGMAKTLVQHFGTDIKDVLDKTPERLLEVHGISQNKMEIIAESWKAKTEARGIFMFLHSMGLTANMADKIYKHYKEKTIEKLKENPYRLADEIWGIGFSKADTFALKMGIKPIDPFRIKAGTLYTLTEATNQGHTYIPATELVIRVQNALRADVSDGDVAKAIKLLHDKGDVVGSNILLDGKATLVVYPTDLYEAEVAVSNWFGELAVDRADSRDMGSAENIMLDIKSLEAEQNITLSDEQRQSVLRSVTNKTVILTGGPGTGKCLGIDTPVMMFDGSIKPVQDIKVGEQVMGPDSKPRNVLSTTTGHGNLYKINPIKGDSWICNENHILTVRKSGTNKIWDTHIQGFLKEKRTKEYERAKLFQVPVEFGEQNTPIDPYFLGLWLGDGDKERPRITNNDVEIIQYLKEIAAVWGMRPKLAIDKRNGVSKISLTYKKGNKCNWVRNVLRGCVRDNQKFIPDVFLKNSRVNRLELLAGLIDTDGYLSGNGYEIATKYEMLKDGIAFLARSLGYRVSCKLTRKTIKSLNFEGYYWRLFITGDTINIPVKVARRKAYVRKQIKNVLNTGFKIEPIGPGDYYGFSLDGDSRFLLGDFTVTHNSTLSNITIRYFESKGMRVLLAAPTGRAAKRLSEVSGRRASTLHRLLEYSYEDPRNPFIKNQTNPLDCDVLLLDEVSMVDLWLFHQVIKALPKDAHFVMVGDDNQLPSVRAGAVLKDLIATNKVIVNRLTHIFRQDSTNLIALNAANINKGLPLMLPSTPEETAKSDFIFLERTENANILDTVLKLVTEILPRKGVDLNDIQILTPQKKGDLGTYLINKRVQEISNAQSDDKAELLIGGDAVFRVGDRVMQVRNNYGKDVFNGDIGFIQSIDEEDMVFLVEYSDKIVSYKWDEAEELILAYAQTIHKSQGGEYPIVVMVMTTSHHIMLYRNLFYTGVTRGKKLVFLVGDDKAVRRAILNDSQQARYSHLGNRINRYVEKAGL